MKKFYLSLALLGITIIPTSCSKDSEVLSEPENITEVNGNAEKPDDTTKQAKEPVVYMLPETHSITLSNEQRQMVKRCNTLSYDLFKAVSSAGQQKGKSLLLSPLSLMYVLGMLNDGAGGDTEAEISSLFGLPADSKAAINGYCQTLLAQAPLVDPSVMLHTANIVATASDMMTTQRYREDVQRCYAAETSSLDFTQPSSLQFLNCWCNEETQGIIPSILDRLDPATRMVLMNAVYFKATWTEKFDTTDTRDEAFAGEDAQTAIVPMMHRKAIALYAPGDVYSALCLPYGSGTRWQMMVLQPNEGKTVDDVVSSLTSTSWEDLWQRNRDRYLVDIKMPRFRTASDVVLNDIVSQIGAPLMFSGQADFSSMTENHECLFVSLLKQKTAIEVSEEGTKASAVSAAGMITADLFEPQEVDFHANRPFVYIIREDSSGAVFFIGIYRGE